MRGFNNEGHHLGMKAISFDGDGTLWDFDKVMRHALSFTRDELGRHHPREASSLEIDTMIQIRDEIAARLKGTTTNLEDIRLESFRAMLSRLGHPSDALAKRLNEVYLLHRFEDIELFDDVLPALEALRRTHVLGLLSNGNSYPDRCGLEGVFHFVVFSQDHGVEKPDPRIFQIAVSQSGCPPQGFVHVGDSFANDVRGARQAGIAGIWLNRKSERPPEGERPNREIRTLAELPGTI